MSYQLNRVHLLICIFAGLVLTGGGVWHLFFGTPSPLFTMVMWVNFGIVVFYCIGQFARSILIKKVFVPEEKYGFLQDEEYKEFTESLETETTPPTDVMFDDPTQAELEFDDPVMEPMPLNDAS